MSPTAADGFFFAFFLGRQFVSRCAGNAVRRGRAGNAIFRAGEGSNAVSRSGIKAVSAFTGQALFAGTG